MSSAFLHFTTDAGIVRQHTVRNRPQQNGVAERANRTMAEGVTAMLAESGLPMSFWGEALASFVHVSNCLPTASISKQTTPYQLWHGRKPDVAPFRVWGCLAYVHVQKDKRKHGCDSFSHGPVSSLCNSILLWPISHRVLTHNPCICGETKEDRRHVLPSFIIAQGLDLRIQMVLSIGFECFERFKGVRLGSNRENNTKSSEVVDEGHPVAKSRVGAHRERPMEIRMNELQRASCLGLRSRKGIGMHLARQAGLANGIWGEF